MSLSIQQSINHRDAIEALFADLSFTPGKRVFVKPNLWGREPVLPGENTSAKQRNYMITNEVIHKSSI